MLSDMEFAIILLHLCFYIIFIYYYLCVLGYVALSKYRLYKKPVFQSNLFCGLVDIAGAASLIWIDLDIAFGLDASYEIYLRIAGALTGALFVLHLCCILVPTLIQGIRICMAPRYYQFTSSFYVFSYLALATAISFAVFIPLCHPSYAFEYTITEDGRIVRGLRKNTVTEFLLVSFIAVIICALESIYEMAAIFYLEDPKTKKYCQQFFKLYFFAIMISNGPIISVFMKEIREPVWNFIKNLPCFHFCNLNLLSAEVAPNQADPQINENENGNHIGDQMEMKELNTHTEQE